MVLNEILVETGHFALVLSFTLSCVQASLSLAGSLQNSVRLMLSGRSVVLSGFFLIFISFISLILSHVQSDFSVANVWENSHSLEPTLYKITGTWASHEGSMVLWALLLSFFNAVFLISEKPPLERFYGYVVSLQGWILGSFLLFILLTSNPFIRIDIVPIEGKDLNPLLQDIALSIHPPLLYIGYAGFSVCFCCAVAALITGNVNSSWARLIHPWVLISWVFLTAGISVGSFWAYYELGWGGFWFWDPVENLAFIPWLTGTALLHCLAVLNKKEALQLWVLFLSIITFSLSILGTFLVRSGLLTSVHAFASDPTRGVFIFLILTLFVGGALFLFALRAPFFTKTVGVKIISREGVLIINNFLLISVTATILIGTLYPMFLEVLTGKKISVGAPYFNATFIPLIIPLLLLLPFGRLLSWNEGHIRNALSALSFPFWGGILCSLIFFYVSEDKSFFVFILMSIAFWVILGSFAHRTSHERLEKNAIRKSFSLKYRNFLSGASWAHCGVGVLMLGVIGATILDKEAIVIMKPSDTVEIGGHTVQFDGLTEIHGSNYIERRASFIEINTKKHIYSSRRFYLVRKVTTTESGIENLGLGQIYIALGEQDKKNGGIVVHVLWKPMITLIWIGSILMILGGVSSLIYARIFSLKKSMS